MGFSNGVERFHPCAPPPLSSESLPLRRLVFGNEAKMRADRGNENAYLLYVLLNEIQE
jgi:hypothetical protein